MTHDPLCTWRQAEEADAGDPLRWLAGGLAVCDCLKIAEVREDAHDCDSHGNSISISCGHWWSGYEYAITKCIEAVAAAARDRLQDLRTCNKDDGCYVKAEGVALMLDDAIYELRALREPDTR